MEVEEMKDSSSKRKWVRAERTITDWKEGREKREKTVEGLSVCVAMSDFYLRWRRETERIKSSFSFRRLDIDFVN